MAQSGRIRRPTVVPDEVSDTKMRVTLLVEGLKSKGKQGAKNGTIDLQFHKSGMNFTASLKDNKDQETQWEYRVRRLPCDINVDSSTWKAENGKIIVDLVKVEPMSWNAMISRGLDQADSSDED